MPTRRRKKRKPRHINGENVPENIGFSFVAPRELTNQESFAAPDQPEDDDCGPENIELSPSKKIKLTFGETDPETAKFSVPPRIPFRVIPVYASLQKFTGIPMGRFSVNLECDASLGRLLASDPAPSVNLVWASTGLPCHRGSHAQEPGRDTIIPVQQFINVVLRSGSLYLPAKIEPALQTLSAIESLPSNGRQQKYHRLVFAGEDCVASLPSISSLSFKVDIFASNKLCEFDSPSELPRKSESSQALRALVEGLYPGAATPTPDENLGLAAPSSQQMSFVATMWKFYEDVQRQRRAGSGADIEFDTAAIPGLTANLRGYQRKAVAWMLRKEKGEEPGEKGEEPGEMTMDENPLHMLWTELPSMSGRPVYFNRYTGRLSSKRFSPHPWPRGGILADEMGLGKTVEVLALVMAHRWPGGSGTVARGSSRGSPDPSAGPAVSQSTDCSKSPSTSVSEGNEASLEVTTNDLDAPNLELDERGTENKAVESSGEDALSSKTENGTHITEGSGAGMQVAASGSANAESGDHDVRPTVVTTQDDECSSKVTSKQAEAPSLEANSGGTENNATEFTGGAFQPSSRENGASITGTTMQITPSNSPIAESNDHKTPTAVIATPDGKATVVNSEMLPPTQDSDVAPPPSPPEPRSSATTDAGSGSPRPPMSTLSYFLAQLEKEDSESRHPVRDRSATGTGTELDLSPDTITAASILTRESSSAYCTTACGIIAIPTTVTGLSSTPGLATIDPSRPSTPQPTAGPSVASPQTPAALRSPVKDRGDVVACVCGATAEGDYEGEFVQCDLCGTWQHSKCVGFDSSKQANFYCSECQPRNGSAHTPTAKTPPTSTSRKIANDVIICVCRATSRGDYKGQFVQCERCKAWQHAECGGFDPSKHSSFTCVNCLLDGEPLPAGTTLIISPQTIVQQWMEEIWKHTDSEALRFLHYRGVKVDYMSPLELASYDIVLVTYETLRAELNYANSHEVRRTLRHRKRYGCAPSPLPAVLWWRICLDEAQMVESTHAKAAEMTQKLSAVNRWCVTGTPVQRNLLDLHGLLLFLGVDPYSQFGWFNRLLWQPFAQGREEAMVSLFARLMWRNSKTDVADELHLPPQTEELHWLSFSPVEAYFYRRQQETCSSDVAKILSRLPEGVFSLSGLLQSTVHKLMTPLHSLRQACCHPQIVRGGYLPINMSNRNCLTMADLLEKLVQQAKAEGREALRQMVAALNGLAALHIIQEEWPQAVSAYREAMLGWQEHEEHLECDKLQRIHTMENLSELLREGHGGDAHTLRDDRLTEEAAELRSKYMEKPEGQVRAAAEALETCRLAVAAAETEASVVQAEYLGELPTDSCGVPMETDAAAGLRTDATASPQPGTTEQSRETADASPRNQDGGTGRRKKPVTPSEPWWVSAIQWAVDHMMSRDLLEAVNAELSANRDIPFGFTQLNFRNTQGMQLLLYTHTHKLQELRTAVLGYLEQLVAPPTPELVMAAATCHLRRDDSSICINLCDLCRAEQVTVEYEGQLFSRYHAADEGLMRSEHGDGSRGMSVVERILRCLLVFARHKRAPRKLIESAQTFMAVLESFKKEYKAMRSLWLVADQRLCACDELRMAATRLRLATPSELLEEQDVPFAVPVFELPARRMQFQSDKEVARAELSKSLGQLLYLQNLTKAQEAGEEQCSEPCPVCTRPLGKEWGVFTCGHPLCMECTFTMVRLQRQRMPWGHREVVSVRCPLCRVSSLSTEINYVRTGSGLEEETAIKGSHSTKIVGITRTLLNIQRGQPGTKSLVFSSWLEVLDLIARALRENDVKFSLLKTKATFQQNLTEFKTSPDVNVLLLPVHSGSKGLNIVEATHVLLVEPSLNIGAELQAIGRVHRMGQTKPTTVHRFYIKHTVEERIHELLNNKADKTQFLISNERESALTLEELQDLFQD